VSVQLRPDEALEALQAVDAESAARWEALLCAATSAIGAELARHHDCIAGEATMQAGFGGLCVPMNPARPGQPFPDDWEHLDDGGRAEWEAEAERLEREAEEGPAKHDGTVNGWRLVLQSGRACYWFKAGVYVALRPGQEPSDGMGGWTRLDSLMKAKGEAADFIALQCNANGHLKGHGEA
jgi:hypothetical protein